MSSIMRRLERIGKLIMLGLVVILISGCGKSIPVKDSYCDSLIPMRGYWWVETVDPPLYEEIHGNMKRYDHRGC